MQQQQQPAAALGSSTGGGGSSSSSGSTTTGSSSSGSSSSSGNQPHQGGTTSSSSSPPSPPRAAPSQQQQQPPGGGGALMLSLHVDSLEAMRHALKSKGQHCFGAVFSDDTGKWAVQFYPHGDTQARDGYVSVFVKVLALPRGTSCVKIEGNIRIVEGQSSLRVTKAFGKSSAFLNPNADGLATSSSWGFHDFCQLSELPARFTIEAEIIVREVARDDALALHVTSLSELKKHYPRGQSTLGFVFVDPEGGKWSLCLYPNGDNLSRDGQLGVFVKVLALPRGVTAVKIEGNLRIVQAGQVVASRSFPVSTFLNASGTGAAQSSTWGFHDFCEVREVTDSFIVEADITLRDRAKEPSFQEVPEDFSVERLLECVKAAHLRETDEARNSHRVLNEAQLRSLTLDQLLEMQENITNIIKEKRTQENECSVCQDRVKAMACVPCGHRFCSECCTKLSTCPECRSPVTQKIRLF